MRRMKTYTIGLYEKAMPEGLSWVEKLQASKEAGFDFVEISIDASEDKISRIHMTKDDRMDMVRWMYETGMPIRTMNVSALTKYALGDDDPKICERGMEILEKALVLADDLGVRIVMIPGYDIYYGTSTEQTRQRFIRNLKKASMMAASLGILLEMETMENEFMNTVWKAMYYVKMIDSVYLGVYPDCGNLKNAAVIQGSNELQDLESGRGYISALHLKETIPGIFREIPFGEGHVDFEKMIKTAWNIGVRKYVAEFWYKGNPRWHMDLVDANRRMCGILDKMEENQK